MLGNWMCEFRHAPSAACYILGLGVQGSQILIKLPILLFNQQNIHDLLMRGNARRRLSILESPSLRVPPNVLVRGPVLVAKGNPLAPF